MHRNWRNRVRAGVVLASLALVGESATAIGTASGISVDNIATVEYAVGATTQPTIESSPTGNTTGTGTPTSFLVDNMVDLTVSETSLGYTTVAAGGANEVLVYTVRNTGNTVQDFSLSAADLATAAADPFGGNDNFDATGVGIFVDANNDGLYDAGDTATYIDELAADTDVEVFVVRSIPALQVSGDVSGITLTAQVAQGGTLTVQGADITADDAGSADDPTLVQIVFADGSGDTDDPINPDGKHSDTDAYRVGAAVLTVAKTSQVISDPVNGASNPKAIPGAIVEYTVTISNDVAATATATSVQVTDDLDAQITAGTIDFNPDSYGGVGSGLGMEVTAPNINGGVATPLSNIADPDQGDFTANVVTVGGISLNAGDTATVRFQVVIQ